MSWFKEDEDALVERNLRSLRAEASLYGDARVPEGFLRSIAFGQALATLHHRETLRALRDTAPRRQVQITTPQA